VDILERPGQWREYVAQVNGSKIEGYNLVNSDRNSRASCSCWTSDRELLFEEIFESLPSIVGAWRRGGSGGRYLGRLSIGCGGGVFFDGHAEFVELAVVLGVLGSDAFWNGLGALELGAGIEEAALLATVKFELALGTLAVGVEAGGQDGAAIGASAAGYCANHARGARAELIRARTALRRLAVVLFSFFAFFRVAVSAMTVLSIHKRLRPDAMPDCDHDCLDFCADAHSHLGMNPTGLLHSAHSAIVTQRIRTGLATSKQEMGHLCF
jgi:hypothetical protein